MLNNLTEKSKNYAIKPFWSWNDDLDNKELRDILRKKGIPFTEHYSRKIRPRDYDYYDYIIAMDLENISDMEYIVGVDKDNKIKRLLDYTSRPRNIRDPWYTGNFDETYDDVIEGCEAFFEYLNL